MERVRGSDPSAVVVVHTSQVRTRSSKGATKGFYIYDNYLSREGRKKWKDRPSKWSRSHWPYRARERMQDTKAEKLLHDLNLNFQSCKLNIKVGEELVASSFSFRAILKEVLRLNGMNVCFPSPEALCFFCFIFHRYFLPSKLPQHCPLLRRWQQ